MNRDSAGDTIMQASSWLPIFLLGVATGTVIGLLTAPRSGRETVKALLEGAGEEGLLDEEMERARPETKMSNSGREIVDRAPHDIGGPRIANTRSDMP